MTGAASEEELLLKIQCLVSDSLGVVSYKWLSRNFSISSNVAKRVLQHFAERNPSLEVVVVYAISGWTKKEPQTYAIQLVPDSKLEEAKCALKGTPSIHVYSVQRCLPKDPAQLWSADFAQAEQLFNESADVSNCLRDNRFSAVTCSLAQRSSAIKVSHISVAQVAPPASNGPSLTPSSTISLKKEAVLPANAGTDLKDVSVRKKATPPSVLPKTPHNESKDSVVPSTAVRNKSSVATGGSGGGSSLASMWGKAPSKPQESAKTSTVTAPAIAGDAETRILAMEADDVSEDEMTNEASLRRGQVSSGSGRRRRRIIDDSDGEGEDSEPIVRLGTPDSPQERKPAVTATQDVLTSERNASSVSEMPNPENVMPDVDANLSKLQANAESKPWQMGGTKPEKEGEQAGGVKAVSEVARVPKRKKVLKTWIDERGREVSEVIWESEGPEKENVGLHPPSSAKQRDAKPPSSSAKQRDAKPPAERPQVLQKPSVVPSKGAAGKGSTKGSVKAMGKPGKGQGNIMSFFKKT